MAFSGHFEAHYERLGFYLDGNYMGLDFRPHLDQGISKGISTRMGIMDYGASYRLFGSSAAERVSHWDAKNRSTALIFMQADALSGWVLKQSSLMAAVCRVTNPSPRP
jgi:hypothetical protein